MVQKYLYILLINLTVIGACNNNKIQKNTVDFEEVYLESQYPTVGCGNIFYAYGFIFKSVKTDSVMIGIIRCPDGYGDNFFREGQKYKIKYADKQIADSIKGYSLTNPFSESKLITYLITEINKIP